MTFRRMDVKAKSGYDFSGQLFVVQSLDGFDYNDAKALITRAKASDGSFPAAEILCMHAEDEARGARGRSSAQTEAEPAITLPHRRPINLRG